MDVRLLNHTPEPERAIAAAARLCYAPVGAAELMESMSDEAVRKVLRTIMRSGHFSALEHATYTFAIEWVSRVLTHMLVRHRLASFNQQSQRYTTYDPSEGFDIFVVPRAVLDNPDPEVLETFREAGRQAVQAYFKLLEMGVEAEDARYILPFGSKSNIVVSMNIRELLHFFSLRCCNRAQDEINQLAHRMLQLAEPTAPYIFMDAGAGCRRGSCPEGSMCCGNPYERAPKR